MYLWVYVNSICTIRIMLCYVQVFTILPEGLNSSKCVIICKLAFVRLLPASILAYFITVQFQPVLASLLQQKSRNRWVECRKKCHVSQLETLKLVKLQLLSKCHSKAAFWLFLTQRATFLLTSPFLSSLHSFAASTLAGESPLGFASIEMTLIMMISTVWIGNQHSSGFS